MLNQLAFALANGLSAGTALFLVAAGLTLVFGILKILNFAHGSFFMIGAYVAFTIAGDDPGSIGGLLAASLAAGVVVAALGFLSDAVVFRRLRQADHASSLIVTFALLLICNGAVKLIWGLDIHSVAPPDSLTGSVKIGPVFVPTYSLFIMLLGCAVFVLLDVAVHRMWVGKIVQAVAEDSWFSALAGINVPLLFLGAVVFAFLLTGFAGGVLLPNQSLSPELYSSYLLKAFSAVVVGGLGNVRGTFIAAIALGIAENLSSLLLPNLPGVTIYLAMVAFLLWRPQGILGSRNALGGQGAQTAARPTRAASPGLHRILLALAALVSISVPAWADPGVLFVAGNVLIAAIFALSWNFLYGTSGLTSFGHAAFFACGAYFVGVLLKQVPDAPFLLLLLGAAALGGAAAAIVAVVAVRRAAGLGLAILTLALSEILQVLISSADLLGRDDGLAAIPRPHLGIGAAAVTLAPLRNYYWFLCAAFLLFAVLLHGLSFSRFGRALNAIRQDAQRASFIGIDVLRHKYLAFGLSGAMAAFAGGLAAPWTQIITPAVSGYLQSAEPMLNALLGGIEFFWGPVLGALIFSVISYGTRTLLGFSEIISGAILLIVILAAPGGVLGLVAMAAKASGDRRPGRRQHG